MESGDGARGWRKEANGRWMALGAGSRKRGIGDRCVDRLRGYGEYEIDSEQVNDGQEDGRWRVGGGNQRAEEGDGGDGVGAEEVGKGDGEEGGGRSGVRGS